MITKRKHARRWYGVPCFVMAVLALLWSMSACGDDSAEDRTLAKDALSYVSLEIVGKTDPMAEGATDEDVHDVQFEVNLTNNSSLHLRYIEGTITIKNRDGELLGMQACQFVGGFSEKSTTKRAVSLSSLPQTARQALYYTAITDLSATFTVSKYCFDVGTIPYALDGDISPLSILTALPDGQGINQTERTYRAGLLSFAKQDYQDALAQFQSVHPYQVTATYIQRCEGYIHHPEEQGTYDKAVSLMKQEKYAEALTLLQGILDYEDAKDQIDILKTLSLQKAEEMAGEGGYANAHALLTSVGYDTEDDILKAYEYAQEGKWMEAIAKGLTIIVLPEAMERIPNDFLAGQSSIKRVVLPSTLTHIGNNAFKDCTSLASINFPTELVSIGASAFEGCVSLSAFKTNATPECLYIGKSAFYGCTSLTTIELAIYDPQHTPYQIDMGAYAFAECSALTYAYMPGKMTSLPEGAFQNCVKLDNYFLSEHITSIGKGAFKGCVALKDMTLPDALLELEDEAFEGCISLQNISIPQNVTRIGAGCFANCTSLTSVNMYNGEGGWTTSRIQEGVYFEVNDAKENAKLLTSVSGYNNAIWTKWRKP